MDSSLIVPDRRRFSIENRLLNSVPASRCRTEFPNRCKGVSISNLAAKIP